MPDNHIPAAQPDSGAEPAEFNFDKPVTENPQMGNPRLKRRTLKAKPAGLIKPSGNAISAARELEREAPPLSAEQTQPAPATSRTPAAAKNVPVVVRAADAPTAPPRATPSASTTASQPASSSAAPKTATTSSSTSSSTTSPHGTRPATLYYSSYPRKDKDAAPSPMKTIPTSGQASPASASAASATTPSRTAATTSPTSTVRPSTTTSSRPAGNIDYRANVERQSREQKSVGSLLSYIVYAFIALFVICIGLAGYGANVIFKRLADQSTTVTDLDHHYAEANKVLTASLATTQESLVQAQAQITRQQEVIVKQQEELNHLITATSDNAALIKTEKQTRAQETTALRSRVRDLENRSGTTR